MFEGLYCIGTFDTACRNRTELLQDVQALQNCPPLLSCLEQPTLSMAVGNAVQPS